MQKLGNIQVTNVVGDCAQIAEQEYGEVTPENMLLSILKSDLGYLNHEIKQLTNRNKLILRLEKVCQKQKGKSKKSKNSRAMREIIEKAAYDCKGNHFRIFPHTDDIALSIIDHSSEGREILEKVGITKEKLKSAARNMHLDLNWIQE